MRPLASRRSLRLAASPVRRLRDILLAASILQVQSKASAITTRDIVVREVGVAQALHSNVILFVSARAVGDSARKAAETYMRLTNLTILFIDGADLDKIDAGTEIVPTLAREFKIVRPVRQPR